MGDEQRAKKIDKWAWWIFAIVVVTAVFLAADFVGFFEFFWK